MTIKRPIFTIGVAMLLNLMFLTILHAISNRGVSLLQIVLMGTINYILAVRLWNKLINWIVRKAQENEREQE